MTRERRLSLELVNASWSDLDDVFECDVHLDRPLFLRELADAASDEHAGAGRHTVLWALEKSRAVHDGRGESMALRMLAFIALDGDFELSLNLARQAVAAGQLAGDADSIAGGHFSAGIASWFRNDTDAAISELRAAAAMIDRLDDSRIGLKSLYMASLIAFRAGRLRDAVAFAAEQRENLRRHPLLRGSVDLAFLLNDIQTELGNPQNALTELGDSRGRRA